MIKVADKRVGPSLSVVMSCFGCAHAQTTRYRVQGDSGWDVVCGHPAFDDGRRIGDTHWDTPDWCPVAPPRDTIRALAEDALKDARPRMRAADLDVAALSDARYLAAARTREPELARAWLAVMEALGEFAADDESELWAETFRSAIERKLEIRRG